METNQNKIEETPEGCNEIRIPHGTNFENDAKYGSEGEKIFEDWCDYKGYKFTDVSKDPAYRKAGIDYLVYFNESATTVDVKYNYKDFNIIIEEHSHYPKKDGWFYTSKAKWFCMINKNDRSEFLFCDHKKMLEWFKDKNYSYKLNKVSYSQCGMWQSSYTKIPLLEIPVECCRIIKADKDRNYYR